MTASADWFCWFPVNCSASRLCVALITPHTGARTTSRARTGWVPVSALIASSWIVWLISGWNVSAADRSCCYSSSQVRHVITITWFDPRLFSGYCSDRSKIVLPLIMGSFQTFHVLWLCHFFSYVLIFWFHGKLNVAKSKRKLVILSNRWIYNQKRFRLFCLFGSRLV